jgi:hypothetical protein
MDLVGTPVKEIEALEKKVRSLRCSVLPLANGCNEEEKVQNILTHLGDLSYIFWADNLVEKMEKEIIFMTSDLQRKTIPSVPEALILFLEVYLGVFNASKPSESCASATVEGVVSSFLNSFLFLDWLLTPFHKIKLLNIEAITMCLEVGRTSLFNFPNNNRVAFVYFLLGSPSELLICKADSVGSLKSQIDVVQCEQEFLRAFLKGIGKHLNEHKKLNGLDAVVMHIVQKADCIIYSLVIRDGSGWCRLLWLFDVLEDVELMEGQSVGMIFDQLQQHHSNILSMTGMTGFGNTSLCLELVRLGMLRKFT